MKKIVLVSFVTTLLLFLGLSPANAHADLLSSYPQSGERLAGPPKYVEVKFDGNLIVFGKVKVNVVSVTDSSGTKLDDGNSITKGPYVKVGLLNQPIVGNISVRWRVTSDDGHPVEGGYKFYVGSVLGSPSSSALSAPKVKAQGHVSRDKAQTTYAFIALLMIAILTIVKMRARRRKGSQ